MVNAAKLADLLREVAREPGDAWLWGALAPGGGSWVEAQGLTVHVALGEGGELTRVQSAQRDGEVIWSWGCERNWIELGDPVNPAALLSAQERKDVGAALMALPAVAPNGVVAWDFEAVGMRRLNWEKAQKKAKRNRRR